MRKAHFSRIAIVQSLGVESPTGKHLRDALESTARFDHDVGVDFFDAADAPTFWKVLEQIRDRITGVEEVPIVHIEAHGLDDKSGLCLGDGTAVDWSQLKVHLTAINRRTGCRLLVTLAACYGAHMQATLDLQSEAPCWALMGPSGVVSPPDLVSSYSKFFSELLIQGDADMAMNALQKAPDRQANYFLRTAEDFFKDVFQLYRRGSGSSAQFDDRVARFKGGLKKMGYPGEADWLRGMMMQSEIPILARFFTRFFFVEQFPENLDRFEEAMKAMKY